MMNVATIEKTPPDKSESPPVWWNFNQPRASDADRTFSQSRNRRATTSVSHALACRATTSVSHALACRATTFVSHATAVQPPFANSKPSSSCDRGATRRNMTCRALNWPHLAVLGEESSTQPVGRAALLSQ